jgi:LmbE family N-acetylglucosaminyl deacetylase
MSFAEDVNNMIDKKMIVFAPHPDDETLACGGIIMKEIREGYDVYIVLMTDGRHSHDLILGLIDPPPEAIAKIRAIEFSEAMKILGVNLNNLFLLGFEDSKLREHVARAEERTAQILRDADPVEIYVPYRDDNHEDHRATYEIVVNGIKEANLRARLCEYPVWNREPPQFGLKVLLVDIRDQLPRKLEAISKYRSQISKCFPNQEKAILSEDFLRISSSSSETFYTRE